jgi:hypothetical protein
MIGLGDGYGLPRPADHRGLPGGSAGRETGNKEFPPPGAGSPGRPAPAVPRAAAANRPYPEAARAPTPVASMRGVAARPHLVHGALPRPPARDRRDRACLRHQGGGRPPETLDHRPAARRHPGGAPGRWPPHLADLGATAPQIHEVAPHRRRRSPPTTSAWTGTPSARLRHQAAPLRAAARRRRRGGRRRHRPTRSRAPIDVRPGARGGGGGVVRGRVATTCPVRAVEARLELFGTFARVASGPLFSPVRRGEQVTSGRQPQGARHHGPAHRPRPGGPEP